MEQLESQSLTKLTDKQANQKVGQCQAPYLAGEYAMGDRFHCETTFSFLLISISLRGRENTCRFNNMNDG